MSIRPIFNRAALIACAAIVLAGCEGLGDGNKPTTLFIGTTPTQQAPGAIELETLATTECQPRSLTAFARFESGSVGDFGERVTWTSSNEDVLRVSNGEIPIDSLDGVLLPRGTLLPVAAGEVTLTASFSTLSASIPVTVQTLDSVVLTPADVLSAPGTSRQYRLTGTATDGSEVNLTLASTWSIAAAEEGVDVTTLARVGSATGVFGADAEGAVNITADVNFCDFSATTGAIIETPASIELRKEFADTNQLIVGTTEAFELFAIFDGGSEQDITVLPAGAIGQVTARSEDAAQGLFGFNGATEIFLSLGLGDGTVDVSATFDPMPPVPVEGEETPDASDALLESNTITLELVEADLTALDVTPLETTLGPLESQQYAAIGTFDNTMTQDITRHVRWASSDQTIAFVTNLALFAGGDNGLAFSSTFGGTVDVTATCRVAAEGETLTTISVCGSGSESLVGTATLIVDAPAADDTDS